MTETKMRLEDWLDDLCVRFIINLPREELESVERICFQVEEAQWFYEDFIRPLDPALPSLNLRAFALRIFQHCPLMSQWSHYHHLTAFSEFLAYKTRVPVRGAILLNQEMDEVVLVKGWKKGANWSFPRGKINKDEKDLDCAIREVYEETGYDVREAGLVPDEKDVKTIEITMREQHMMLFVFRGVPRDTHFEPRTRKEISKIEWYKLSDLPTLKSSKQQDQGLAVANANKFYMVAPFMHPLKKWIAYRKRLDAKAQPQQRLQPLTEGELSADDTGRENDGWTEDEILARYHRAPPAQRKTQKMLATHANDTLPIDLKRVLNIDSASHAPSPSQAPRAMQTPDTDSSKSNALLQLLRSGSAHGSAPQQSSQGLPSAPQLPPGPEHPELPTYPAPMFPGFPPQHSFHYGYPPPPPPNFMPPPPNGPAGPMPHPGAFMPPRAVPHGPAASYSGLPTYPQQAPPPQSRQSETLSVGAPAPPRSHAPAPFQRTGDPQFSHSAQLPQDRGATIPPAKDLPPPKLTSHSLALLNVFKDESSKTPKGATTGLIPPPSNEPLNRRKQSQHQDELLNLFKGKSNPPPRSTPAELAAPTISQSPRQILQRPRGEVSPVSRSVSAPKAEAWTSATVSGPLNIPQLGTNTKSVRRNSPSGSNPRHNARDRQTRSPSSPITILSRPQAVKQEHAPGPEPIRSSRSPSQTGGSDKPRSAEPPKPFQPQILRRSANGDSILPVSLKETAHESQSEQPVLASQEPKRLVNHDRRPSQTAAQRETLLSLFGKASTSPGISPAVQANVQTSISKPPAASSTVSPLSPLNLPTTVATSESSPREDVGSAGVSGVASPDNKAFLLGFLQGVAKGNK
ncbi:Dcp2, box A domain-containing protein [Aspergillus ambiguus]|uniref:decapping enzyme complex catalytic subunit DCP2 n=1 Tax=Aspergillus ambiguus TaxID=176160 RepID=UPI003CCE165E